MAKRYRTRILLLILAVATLVECKKSEGSKPANIFGATPQVSNVVITKVRRTFHCEQIVIRCSQASPNCASQLICAADPGCTDSRFPPGTICDCCCLADQREAFDVEQDLVTATAKVQDQDGISNILVVILRFLDNISTGSSSLPQQVSLEMFDTGSVDLVPDPGVQLSGDLTAGDGTYTRSFYLTNSTSESAGTCVEDTDQTNQGGTFSSYQSNTSTSPSDSKEFRFTIQAIDLQGNIGSGPEIPLPIQGTFRDTSVLAQRGCGAPNGIGGCASTTGPL